MMFSIPNGKMAFSLKPPIAQFYASTPTLLIPLIFGIRLNLSNIMWLSIANQLKSLYIYSQACDSSCVLWLVPCLSRHRKCPTTSAIVGCWWCWCGSSAHILSDTYIHMHAHMHTYRHVHTNVHTLKYTLTYTYMHKDTHRYTHIYTHKILTGYCFGCCVLRYKSFW